ncbi:hypothetical protein BY996DRAFT_6409041 [Phakopsora pachyrhizi]|nr:hypothetical protein BY996DRAFT_6409041 [Phakopsora pachyrhizi]
MGTTLSLTSTINLIFGSEQMDQRNGIILNNELDDFSIPGRWKDFNLSPSPLNYPEKVWKQIKSYTLAVIRNWPTKESLNFLDPVFFIEVEVDRSNVFLKTNWSPLQVQKFIGTAHRVVLRNETVYLDGLSYFKTGSGKYLGASLGLSARAVVGKTQHLQSVTDARKALSSFGSLGSPQLSTLQMQKARSSSTSLNPGRIAYPTNNWTGTSPSLSLLLHPLCPEIHMAGSSRTVQCCPRDAYSASFEAAMNQLGGRVVSVLVNKSSATKGEKQMSFFSRFLISKDNVPYLTVLIQI